MNKETTEQGREEIIRTILENANGSWSDMITEGFEAGIKFAAPSPQSSTGVEEMRLEFVASLKVLRNMLDKVGLAAGVETADYLLNKYEQK